MLKLLNCACGALVASSGERLGHLKLRPNFFHMAVGAVLVTAIIVLHVQLIRKLDLPALLAISFFNLLFVFFLFPLEGTLLRKVALLFAGNLVGALWYFIPLSFEKASISFLNTDAFKIITVVASPLIDFVWVVSVWSLSLSVLAYAKYRFTI